MKQTLYQITGDVLTLQEMLESDEYDEEVINTTLESVMYDLDDKADDYVKVIRNMEARVDAISNEQERLAASKKVLKNGIQRMKDAIKNSMEVTGKKKAGNIFTISLRNNAKQLPKNITYKDVPEEYWKPIDPEVDRKKLLADVKAGIVDNIELVQSKSIMIK